MKTLFFFIKFIFKLLYKVEVSGLEHVRASAKRTVILANHTSFLDPLLLALFLPAKVCFTFSLSYPKSWWLRLIAAKFQVLPIDHSDPLSIKNVIEHLQQGHTVVIFPEGRVTATGSLMKVYPSSGMIADRADATILPVRINGAQFSRFSLLKGQFRIRWFPKIKLTVLPAQKIELPSGLSNRERRQLAGQAIENIMREMVFETSPHDLRLWDALLEAASIHGKRHLILEDTERCPLSYSDIFTRCMVLQQLIPSHIKEGERVGLLLPNVSSCFITFFALQARGLVPAMLNYTMGESATTAALKAATIQTVFTSRAFVAAAELESLILVIKEHAEIIYLEDLREHLKLSHKIKGLLLARLPSLGVFRNIRQVTPEDAAVVLFTSGSEGLPKGVVLSHKNILSNIQQVYASISFDTSDVCLNALPLFHSFGLTAGSLMMSLAGIKTFLYPSPLHYRVIPEVAYEINATIIFGTNVFLAAYARHAHPYDFYTMKYVVAGAEKLQDETRNSWMEKFGIRILEGYGATETSPILSVNTPMYYKAGSVGRFLPGIDYRLEHIPGITRGGRLFVRSPNVMKGYLLYDQPGTLQPPEDNWYDTGDIVTVDDEGFVFIQGRAKRFAKVAGEMISLAAVEELCRHCWPDHEHIALTFPDESKGEKIVLMSTLEKPRRKDLLAYAKREGVSELQVPKQFLFVSEIPLLGSGKIHYVAAQALAEKMYAAIAAE